MKRYLIEWVGKITGHTFTSSTVFTDRSEAEIFARDLQSQADFPLQLNRIITLIETTE